MRWNFNELSNICSNLLKKEKIPPPQNKEGKKEKDMKKEQEKTNKVNLLINIFN